MELKWGILSSIRNSRLSFNRTAYGIEIANKIPKRFIALLLIAPLMELKYEYFGEAVASHYHF